MIAIAQSVTVRLFAGLEAQTSQRRTRLELPLSEVPTVSALGVRLGLAPGVAGLVLVNGLHARDDRVLAPGDEVSLFPPLGGG